MTKDMSELSELLALEKSGRYQEALDRIQAIAGDTSGESPVRTLNLRLLEQRLRIRIHPVNHQVKSTAVSTRSVQKSPIDVESTSWSAIITMWKRSSYIKEQLAAIRGQSIPPVEIIIIINENHISESLIRELSGEDVRVVRSDINSLYTRWTMAYIATGEYVCIFDDDVIPGEFWIANAVRACDGYNALVGSSGRIYNPDGLNGYFKYVGPVPNSTDINTVDCSETDIFCDWVCNSYLFKREWAHYAISARRHKDSLKTFDDIQLAISLSNYGGIRCVTPMQPSFSTKFHGSLKQEYGNDAHAIWLANSEQHFKNRKNYIEKLIEDGYLPVNVRPELHRFHLIVPFADRQYFERCLLSIKGQKYSNYTCTIIDDCCDGEDQVQLLIDLGMDDHRFRYFRSKKRLYALKSRELATDTLEATLSDVVVHLDGDDWLTHPHVLSRLNSAYGIDGTLATYGNGVSYFPQSAKNPFWEFYELYMSRKWGFGSKVIGDEPEEPYRAFKQEEVKEDWRNLPWGAMHLRTFKYRTWCAFDRTHFKQSGEYLRFNTDAAIFLPILNIAGFTRVQFIPDCIYGYLNSKNTIHSKGFISEKEAAETRRVLTNAKFFEKIHVLEEALGTKKGAKCKLLTDVDVLLSKVDMPTEALGRQNAKSLKMRGQGAVVSVITPNYLADGLIAVKTFAINVTRPCEPYLFASTRDMQEINQLEILSKNLGYKLLHPQNLEYTSDKSLELEKKYSIGSDEYRWAMKSVVLLELLARGYDYAIFQDPDMYTVSNIDDIVEQLINAGTMVFPHFRDPEDEYLRKVLYRDGFFNGGMIGATQTGVRALSSFYKRCLNEMKKDPERERWDDQKYLDLWVLESNDVLVNTDRGIDYNPWNYEQVEGMIAPTQRSYLLKSGFFIRNWHVSTNKIKQTVENHSRHVVYKPIVAIYMHTLLIVMGIIATYIKHSGHESPMGLNARWNKSIDTLKSIAKGEVMKHGDQSIESLSIFFKLNSKDALMLLKSLIMNGISFDNILLYKNLLSSTKLITDFDCFSDLNNQSYSTESDDYRGNNSSIRQNLEILRAAGIKFR